MSRLEWRCRRGTRELDLLLQGYLHHQYNDASPQAQQAFEHLLELPDPELYELLTGYRVVEDRATAGVVEAIRQLP